MERNGNLVVLAPGGRAIWSSHTSGHRGARAVMQRAGNLIVESAGGRALWSSRTAPSRGDRLVMQDDGNLVVYSGDGRPLWSVSTGWLGNGTWLAAAWSLKPGQKLWSGSHKFEAIMQSDGNFVVYAPGGRAIWNSQTEGNPGASVTMQTDGNLVVYSASGKALWWTSTEPSPRDHLVMQNDGNLVVYTGDGRPLWSVSTGWLGNGTWLSAGWTLKPGQKLWSANHQYEAIMQHDGNFVVYAPGARPIWNSHTEGHPGASVKMQTDGNLVVYSAAGKALWWTSTQPSQGDHLVMQTDGNLVIYNNAGNALWSTYTGLLKQVWAPWTPGAPGFYDEHDYSDPGPCGTPDKCEWGIDVPLAHGTAIYAPEAGTIVAYEQWSYKDQCGIAWCPGRLLERLDSNGAVVAFGHVNPIVTSGPVHGGQEIATVAYNSSGCTGHCDPGDGDHVEFMYDSSGNAYDSTSSYHPSGSIPAGSGGSGCPHHGWSAADAGVDPCAVLTRFMHGNSP